MTKRIYTALLNVAFFAALSVLAVSCSDDDEKVDCDATLDQIETKFDDFYTAYDDEDCDEMQSTSEEILNLLQKGKNCEGVKSEVEDAGYDSVDEFIDELEEEFDVMMADC